jgi:16S rRNA (adenine1518-N6/adenine1519-N6)-dimethyltransferase
MPETKKSSITAKRSLGQNFLRDEKILKKIADFAQIKKGETVVEVGPGEGTLTALLLKKAGRVVAIEKDARMIDLLKEKFAEEIEEEKLEIICGDILSPNIFPSQAQKCTDIFLLENSSCSAQSASQGISELMTSKYLLVGNIPYYITGALFKKALEAENPPGSITFVVQKEVADRIMARDGKESILSISIKAYGKPEYGGVIKAGSFHPAPKVDSAIISIRDISKKRFEEITSLTLKEKAEIFFEILKAGFAHKRKLLIRNLEEMPKKGFDISRLKEIFKKCDLSEKARAEELNVNDWICLAKNLALS